MFQYQALEDLIVEAVRTSCEGKDVGIAFSGGLDSGLVASLAKRYARSVHLYTCGTDNAFDVIMAKDLAERLELPWTQAKVSRSDMERCIRGLIESASTSDPFTISYEMPLYRVYEECDQDIILSGQGSDEYFMGCAKYVGCSDELYHKYRKESIERLMRVSVLAERNMAEYFGKRICYPYLDEKVTEEISRIDPMIMKPKDMDSRKMVLKEIAIHLGFDILAQRKKKSSQYGSGVTDIIRGMAKEQGLHYNAFIANIYEDMMKGADLPGRRSVINAKIDPMVKVEAENILQSFGITPSDAIESFYRRVIKDGSLDFLNRE